MFCIKRFNCSELFKQVVIMKLKMFTKDNIFGKICLKAFRDTFLQYLICNQGRDGVRHEEKREDSLGMSESSILILHKNIVGVCLV